MSMTTPTIIDYEYDNTHRHRLWVWQHPQSQIMNMTTPTIICTLHRLFFARAGFFDRHYYRLNVSPRSNAVDNFCGVISVCKRRQTWRWQYIYVTHFLFDHCELPSRTRTKHLRAENHTQSNHTHSIAICIWQSTQTNHTHSIAICIWQSTQSNHTHSIAIYIWQSTQSNHTQCNHT